MGIFPISFKDVFLFKRELVGSHKFIFPFTVHKYVYRRFSNSANFGAIENRTIQIIALNNYLSIKSMTSLFKKPHYIQKFGQSNLDNNPRIRGLPTHLFFFLICDQVDSYSDIHNSHRHQHR